MTALASESKRKTPARLAGGAILACQSDARLVELLRQGHERAFDAIVSRYRAQLVRFCARILPDSRTEDAVQQAFINAHAALLSADEPPAQLKPWLYTVARNAALNMLRQNGWHYEQIPVDFDGVRRPDQLVEQRIELQNTVAAVNDLPDRQRDAIVMREFEGRSYEEIALALGTGDGAVRQLLNRARGTLRAAASAIMPPPVVSRAASALPPADGRRVAEVLGSFGAAGAAKVGATALVAGSLVVGAVNAPVSLVGGHSTTRAKAVLTNGSAHHRRATDAAAAASSLGVSDRPVRDHGQSGDAHGRALGHGRKDGNQNSHGRSHAPNSQRLHGRDDRGQHQNRSEQHSQPNGGSDDHHSSSGGGESHSGSGTSGGSSHDGSSGRSGSGSDDTTTTRSGSDGGSSGSSGSGSGSTELHSDSTNSGSSGTSGSGSSGSGTSGSSDGGTSGSSGSGSSGSSDGGSSTTSGSGTSGSGSSGSGSDDPLH